MGLDQTFQRTRPGVPEDYENENENEYCYMRNHEHIHEWVGRTLGVDPNEDEYIYISLEEMKELLDRVEKVAAAYLQSYELGVKTAFELLPSSGRFDESDYSEFYVEQIDEDKELLTMLIEKAEEDEKDGDYVEFEYIGWC